MNERIKELAEQAGLRTELWHNPEPFVIYKEDPHNPGGLKKFAELVAAPLQAKIDELMLEYCPDEMTEAQLENYRAHQRPYLDEAIQGLGDI